MAITVITEIADVIITRHFTAQRCRSGNKAVVVVEELVFAVTVVQQGQLADKTLFEKVLPIQVGDKHIIVAQLDTDIIQATVGIFFQTPEPGQIVLKDIVVAGAEKTDAEWAVLKQKAAKVGIERLNTHPDAVKVITV